MTLLPFLGFFHALLSNAFIPGGLPRDYNKGDALAITAEKISSPDSPISYDYFYLPFCKPNDEWHSIVGSTRSMNLGQILKGDSFELTAFEPHMLEDTECSTACQVEFSQAQVNSLISLIATRYEVSLSADDLPAAVAMNYADSDQMTKMFRFDADQYHPETANQKMHLSGYPLGQIIGTSEATLVNHLAFTFFYHHSAQGHYSTRDSHRIVGFEVVPLSVKDCDAFTSSSADSLVTLKKDSEATVTFTYSVRFLESEIPWVTRWDNYLKASNEETEIHWLSLLDSLLVTFTLGLMCCIILLRTVHQDIARYNNLEDIEEIEAESGWKLLHGDVFRRPWGSRAIAGFVGSGVQVIGAATVVILGGGLGILSPANRGSIGQAAVTLFALFGIPAGYVAARLNRVFLANEVSNARSLMVTSVTALIFPGVAFSLYLIANFVIFVNGGASVPFTTVIVLGMLWAFISVPLTIVGAYLGYRAVPIELPCRVNRLPRQVPPVPKFKNAWVLAFSAGIPIVSVAITEIRSVVVSMVFHNFYYLIGYVVVSFLLMLITTSLISVVITYMILLTEEWRWWWPSFWAGASAGLYSFLLSLSLVSSVSNGGMTASFISFCYICILSITLSLMLGSVGVMTSFWFVRSIFSSIKID